MSFLYFKYVNFQHRTLHGYLSGVLEVKSWNYSFKKIKRMFCVRIIHFTAIEKSWNWTPFQLASWLREQTLSKCISNVMWDSFLKPSFDPHWTNIMSLYWITQPQTRDNFNRIKQHCCLDSPNTAIACKASNNNCHRMCAHYTGFYDKIGYFTLKIVQHDWNCFLQPKCCRRGGPAGTSI